MGAGPREALLAIAADEALEDIDELEALADIDALEGIEELKGIDELKYIDELEDIAELENDAAMDELDALETLLAALLDKYVAELLKGALLLLLAKLACNIAAVA